MLNLKQITRKKNKLSWNTYTDYHIVRLHLCLKEDYASVPFVFFSQALDGTLHC